MTQLIIRWVSLPKFLKYPHQLPWLVIFMLVKTNLISNKKTIIKHRKGWYTESKGKATRNERGLESQVILQETFTRRTSGRRGKNIKTCTVTATNYSTLTTRKGIAYLQQYITKPQSANAKRMKPTQVKPSNMNSKSKAGKWKNSIKKIWWISLPKSHYKSVLYITTQLKKIQIKKIIVLRNTY